MADTGFTILGQGSDAVPEAIHELRRRLLTWYDGSRRDLPWRRTSDPYAIWVSEIMLQQTRVAAVLPKYETFLRNFPSVVSLANAAEADVLALWSGLGYYRRARMLHKAAKVVAFDYHGAMPVIAAELRALPGIGAYTSAAIASIAFGEAVAVVDGNVERVVQRLAGWGSDSTGGQAELVRNTTLMANTILDPDRPGDFNQAMMELGATICLPRNPMCLLCPLRPFCQTQGEHPTRPRAKMRSQDAAYALAVRNSGSRRKGREVLLVQRPEEQTVMTGMWELPTLKDPIVPPEQLRMVVRHAIMQVNYYVRIRTVFEDDVKELTVVAKEQRWVPLKELGSLPLTGLTRKVLLRARMAELTATPEVAEPQGNE